MEVYLICDMRDVRPTKPVEHLHVQKYIYRVFYMHELGVAVMWIVSYIRVFKLDANSAASGQIN